MSTSSSRVSILFVAGACLALSQHAYSGEVRGVATDLNVALPLVGVLVEAFEVDAAGNVDADAFTSTSTLRDGTFTLPLGNVDRRVLLKFSQAGRTDVFIPNLATNQASGALVIGAQLIVDDLIVIVPKRKPCGVSSPCCRRPICSGRRWRCRCRR